MEVVAGLIVVAGMEIIHKVPDLTLVNALVPTLLNGVIGVVAGLIVVAGMEIIHKVRGK